MRKSYFLSIKFTCIIDNISIMFHNSIMKKYSFKLKDVDNLVVVEASRLEKAIKLVQADHGNFVFGSYAYCVMIDGFWSSRIIPERYRNLHGVCL